MSLTSPALAGEFFTTCTTWEAHNFTAAAAAAQKSPDTPGSPEGNTEGPGTASSEPLLPS